MNYNNGSLQLMFSVSGGSIEVPQLKIKTKMFEKLFKLLFVPMVI